MKARMPAGFGRPDMNALMRQAQKMQDDMKAKQAELEAAEYTGSASGEMVTVRMNGKHEILGITIKPEAVDPDDVEMLEDLVAAATRSSSISMSSGSTASGLMEMLSTSCLPFILTVTISPEALPVYSAASSSACLAFMSSCIFCA